MVFQRGSTCVHWAEKSMVVWDLPQAGKSPGGKGLLELRLLGTPGAVMLCCALGKMSGSAAQQNKSGRVAGVFIPVWSVWNHALTLYLPVSCRRASLFCNKDDDIHPSPAKRGSECGGWRSLSSPEVDEQEGVLPTASAGAGEMVSTPTHVCGLLQQAT